MTDEPSKEPERRRADARDWLLLAQPSDFSARTLFQKSRLVVEREVARLQQLCRNAFDAARGFCRTRLAPRLQRFDLPLLSEKTSALRRGTRGALTRVFTQSGARLRSAVDGARVRLNWRRAGKFAALASMIVATVCLMYVGYCLVTIPYNGGLVIDPTLSALLVESDDGRLFGTKGVFKGEKLASSELPGNLARAIVAIEDRRFYDHPGIDVRGLARAAIRNTSAGGTREGGSTITQQLVRMLYLSQERSFRRKVQEAMLALWLEAHLTKDEILTTYLNAAYFGAGVYGADAAAKRYFGKSAKDLTVSEAAMLAGLVRAPSQLAPHRNLNGAQGRATQVLAAMVETGAISAEQAEDAKHHPAELRIPAETPQGTNYFIDIAATETRRLIGTGPTDIKTRTTLDLNLQNVAESVVARHLDAEGRTKRASQAALVALAPDGAILAMVGGRDYAESQFNRVTQAKRQAGSLFKLFVYLTALRDGARPETTMVDRPIQIGEWEPENYGGRYRGPVTLRTAFANSINTVAVQLADAVGIPAVINTAKALGIQSDLPNVPSLALGSAEVTLLEITQAYAALAVNAEKVEAFSVRSITSGDKNLYTRPASSFAPQSNSTARAGMLDLLSSVVREGTGKAARLSGPAAGKTGTTQDYRDAWFIGFTPEIIVGVWVGNDDNSPMDNVTGGGIPASIWHDFVVQAGRSLAMRSRPAAAANNAVLAAARSAGKGSPGTEPLRGDASAVDTATLNLNGRSVKLFGVDGWRNGRALRDFDRYLERGEVECQPVGDQASYRCNLQGQDLSQVVLFNGGGRASPEATPELLATEEQARSARVGIWRR
jgi:penicillin-binding protein 1A